MITIFLVSVAIAADPDRDIAIFPDDRAPTGCCEREARPRYEGAVDAPPVVDWTVRLPGPRVNAPTLTERSRPVVVGDVILVGSAATAGLYALSRRDGSVLGVYPSRASVASAATVAGDRVYFADTAGNVYGYALAAAASGLATPLWTRYVGSGVLTAITLSEDRLYVATVGDLALALDAATGAVAWQYQRPADATRTADLALYGRPQPVVIDAIVVCGFSDGALVALDASRGDLAWERRVGEGKYPDLVAAPVSVGPDVYASGYFEPFVAIDRRTQRVRWRVDHGAAAPPAVWLDPDGETVLLHPGTDGTLRAIGATGGDVRWSWTSGSTGALTTPQVTPAGLLIGSSEGGLWLIDAASGAPTWAYHEREMLEGLAVEPTIDGRQILFVTNAGRLHSMIVPRPGAIFENGPFHRDGSGAVAR